MRRNRKQGKEAAEYRGGNGKRRERSHRRQGNNAVESKQEGGNRQENDQEESQ